MKAIQITMDPDLLARLDAREDVQRKGRSAVIREAVEAWLARERELEIRRRYAESYGPDAGLGEDWSGWEDQATWPNE